MLVDELANLVDVALGEDPAVVDQQDGRGHRLDLVQDVARHDDVLAGARPVLDHADGATPGERVTLSLRPEKVALRPHGDAGQDDTHPSCAEALDDPGQLFEGAVPRDALEEVVAAEAIDDI